MANQAVGDFMPSYRLATSLALLAGAGCHKSGADIPSGPELKWLELRDGDGAVSSVMVDECVFEPSRANAGHANLVRVRWRIRNSGKTAISPSWHNKFLVDAEDRRFTPKTGDDVPNLQPTETSKRSWLTYELPVGIPTDGLTWSRITAQGPDYRIALNCMPLDQCSIVADAYEDPDKAGWGHDEIATRCRKGPISKETLECFSKVRECEDPDKRCTGYVYTIVDCIEPVKKHGDLSVLAPPQKK